MPTAPTLEFDSLAHGDHIDDLIAIWRENCLVYGFLPEPNPSQHGEFVRGVLLELASPQDAGPLDGGPLLGATLRFLGGCKSAGIAIRLIVCLGAALDEHVHAVLEAPTESRVAAQRAHVVLGNCTVAAMSHVLAAEDRRRRRDTESGLLNRDAYSEDRQEMDRRSLEDGRSLCLALVDVNGLKIVNDTHGHIVGDALIKGLASSLTELQQPGQSVYRWGGDEFTVLAPDASPEDLNEYLAAVSEISPSISWGIACYPDDTDDLSTLYKLADDRMYEHKETVKAAADTTDLNKAFLRSVDAVDTDDTPL